LAFRAVIVSIFVSFLCLRARAILQSCSIFAYIAI